MGQTIKSLASRPLEQEAVFNNRFVVEICEKVHVHYRNLRIIMSEQDFEEFGRGMVDALSRWVTRGKPATAEGTHIELCRKNVAKYPVAPDEIKVNLNKNLYPLHEGRVFAEGSVLKEPVYVHLKIRDLRLELSLSEFSELSEAIIEAKETLKGGIDA